MGTQRQSVVNIYIYILCNSNILLINEGVYNIHTLSLLFKGCQVEVMEEVECEVSDTKINLFSVQCMSHDSGLVCGTRKIGRKEENNASAPWNLSSIRIGVAPRAAALLAILCSKATEPLLLSYTLRQPTLSVLQKAKRCSNFSPPWHAQHWVKIWKEVG